MLLIVLMVKTMSSNKIKQGHVFKGYFSLNPLDLFLSGTLMAVSGVVCSFFQMWEIRVTVSVPDNYLCGKHVQLLSDVMDQLEWQ